MAERAPARRRWSLRRVRLTAWGSVATAFVGLVGILGVTPKPASIEGTNGSAERTHALPGATRRAAKSFVRRTVEVKPHRSAPVKVVVEPARAPADAPSPPPPSTGGS